MTPDEEARPSSSGEPLQGIFCSFCVLLKLVKPCGYVDPPNIACLPHFQLGPPYGRRRWPRGGPSKAGNTALMSHLPRSVLVATIGRHGE